MKKTKSNLEQYFDLYMGFDAYCSSSTKDPKMSETLLSQLATGYKLLTLQEQSDFHRYVADSRLYYYVFLEISGWSPNVRDYFFGLVDHIDIYTWYVNLDDSISETGDHYICVRCRRVGDVISRDEMDVLEDMKGFFRPTIYSYSPYFSEHASAFTRFQNKKEKNASRGLDNIRAEYDGVAGL